MNSTNCTLTQEELKRVLSYEPNTGIFRWKVSPNKSRIKIGDIAGSLCSFGYLRVKIGRKAYKQHRLAWLYEFGSFPDCFIDHVNGVRTDNRIANLREATNKQNQENRKNATQTSAHGLLGVTFNKQASRWCARIMHFGVRKHIGYFDDPLTASKAYLEAKRNIHSFNTL